MSYPRMSPWDRVQDSELITDSIYWVSTAGHGGLMIEYKVAQEILTPQAILRGESFRSENRVWLCYEEDCQYAIVFYELDDILLRLAYRYVPHIPIANLRLKLLQTISAWNADYLIERGIEPDAVAYSRYKEMHP